MLKGKRIPNTVFPIIIFVATMSLILLLAPFVHHVDDDYCFRNDIVSFKSASDYVYFWWNNWSGRWAGSLAKYYYFSGIGPTPRPWLVPLLLLSITFSVFLIIRALYGTTASSDAAGFLAASFFLLTMSQPKYQIYWATAGFEYTIGYLFLGIFLYCCRRISEARDKSQLYAFVTLALLFSFVASGFSEFQALIPPLVLGGILLNVSYRKGVWALLFATSVIATSVNLFAPGNMGRKAGSEIEIAFLDILGDTILYGLRFVVFIYAVLLLVTFHPWVSQRVTALGKQSAHYLTARGVRAVAISVITYPFVICGVVSWAQGAVAAGRTINLALLLCITTWPLVYWTLKSSFVKKIKDTRIYIKIGLSCLGLATALSVNLPDYAGDLLTGRAARAFEVHKQHDLLLERAASATDVLLPVIDNPPKSIPSSLVSDNPDNWVNRCLARFYNVNSVRTK